MILKPHIHRWLKSFNSIASKKQQSTLAKGIVVDNLVAERAPLLFLQTSPRRKFGKSSFAIDQIWSLPLQTQLKEAKGKSNLKLV